MPNERMMPTPIKATANSASMPAIAAIAPAVTIGGMPASIIETLTAIPVMPIRRQTSRTTNGATISFIARPKLRGASILRGNLS